MFVLASIFAWAWAISWRKDTKLFETNFGKNKVSWQCQMAMFNFSKGDLNWKDRIENRFKAAIREAAKAIPGNLILFHVHT